MSTATITLTAEEKRILIAQHFGFDRIRTEEGDLVGSHILFGAKVPVAIPDYFDDLNAMHEAENFLTADNAWKFNRELCAAIGAAGVIGWGAVDNWVWHATAAQRAEAFGKTLNLW